MKTKQERRAIYEDRRARIRASNAAARARQAARVEETRAGTAGRIRQRRAAATTPVPRGEYLARLWNPWRILRASVGWTLAICAVIGFGVWLFAPSPGEGTELSESGYAACTAFGARVDDGTLYTRWGESVRAVHRMANASADADLIRNAGYMANVEPGDPQDTKQLAADGFAAACLDKGWNG